ncbi:hypothetical protein [Bacillus sp. FJAT-45350]|uniref:hypothetical protein n=1 Tax=Bacillus sp. FJAT-45350 TaxID=2011014 RepID=UPI000BB6D69C|nr:hypothetical protein [Bacillus sp. FJAT-45350]
MFGLIFACLIAGILLMYSTLLHVISVSRVRSQEIASKLRKRTFTYGISGILCMLTGILLITIH